MQVEKDGGKRTSSQVLYQRFVSKELLGHLFKIMIWNSRRMLGPTMGSLSLLLSTMALEGSRSASILCSPVLRGSLSFQPHGLAIM